MTPPPYQIDWLSVSQDHPGGAPILGSDYVIHTDPETGEVTREHVVGYQHEGSFDTSIRIRSDGHRIDVSGNPSRYGREENVFGYATVDQCMAVYNGILRSLGLPEFTKGDGYDRTSTRTVQIVDGARFSRVDLARNYATGSDPDARRAIRALSAQSRRGKHGTMNAAQTMVHWGTRDYARSKYYVKAAELKAHGNTKGCRGAYRDLVTQWTRDTGIVRFEVELGRKLLPRHHLNGWVLWCDRRAQEIADDYDKANAMNTGISSYQEIADELVSQGLKPARATRAQHAAMAWLAGESLRETMSKSSFYRVASDLTLAGLDVRTPCDVTRISHSVRVIDLRPAQAPGFYRWPHAA